MAAQPCVIVGRDVFLYTAQGYGNECNPTPSTSTYDLLSRWRTAQFEWNYNWAETTSSSAIFVTRRLTTLDFRSTLEGLITMVGSPFLGGLSEVNNIVKIVFQEATDGSIITLTAGIVRASYRAQRDQFEDTLELQCVGDVNGDGAPFTYLLPAAAREKRPPAKGGWAEVMEMTEAAAAKTKGAKAS